VSDVVISAEGLGKRYLIGHQSAERERYTALRDVVARSLKGLGRSALDMMRGRQIIAGDEVEEFWALNDVSFEIKRGEVVGIIGRNGAGKSTLLKILSRITEPSEGRVEIRGRVASLLEVGTGFHPELTGRENIYLNGAILGMTRAEIKRKFDEIVDFAGVEKFLDTPVKRYSSGMYVRLAFSVAAHLEPEILVVDEVLAVGDAEFQKRCLGKMQDVAGHGRTVLFVSHQLDMISRLCSRALLMSKGTIARSGEAGELVEHYIRNHRHSDRSEMRIGGITVAATIKKAEFLDEKRLNLILSLILSADQKLSEACILIYTSTEQRIALIDLRITDTALEFQCDVAKIYRVLTEPFPIVAGQYRLTIWVKSTAGAVEVDLGYISAPASRCHQRLTLYPDALNGLVEIHGQIEFDSDDPKREFFPA
jgi:ABC-type polysaccharide/polyol phosphate transport system ATPase subunit